MQQLRTAAGGTGVRALVDALYDLPSVIGFALGVHGNFVSLYHAEFGRGESIEQMLEGGRIPQGWAGACTAAALPPTLSPIYVVVYVAIPPDLFRGLNQVPPIVPPGHLVVVEQIDPFEAAADRRRHRPGLSGGISVGNAAHTDSGTLGGFFQDGAGTALLLSCAHVIADGSASDVVQQGSGDGGSLPADHIGNTRWSVPLTPATAFNFSSPYIKADAALATLLPACTATRTIRSLSGDVTSIQPFASISLGDNVVFVGKESDSTDARVYRFIARAKVRIRGALYNFGDLFEIESRLPLYLGSLVKPGDSGSWVVREVQKGRSLIEYELYGLLFARSGKTGLCCVAEEVRSELERTAGRGKRFSLY